MPATNYKVWQWGDAVGVGVMGSHHVAIAGVAKTHDERNPYAVSNELICGSLGRVLLLPVPPGFIVERDGKPYHVSLNFNLAGEGLPPANARKLVEDDPALAAGIILFDVWIVNTDRHCANMAYDASTKRAQLFDHSHALMRGHDGAAHLDAHRGKLGLSNHNCLRGAITSLAGMEDWYRRIRSVPSFYVEEVVRSATRVGLPEDKVSPCIEFLLERREQLLDLVAGNKDQFPGLVPELWDGFNRGGDDE